MASTHHDHTEAEAFEAVWRGPSGLKKWLAEVNNQPLGRRFMVTAFSFFLVGGLLGLLMRVQLTVSENTFLGPQVYNQLFTMHGSTMMYLFAVPFLEGLALYILPLMLGSRDVAFPRLTAFSYWTYLFGGLIFYASFLTGTVPEAGWFAYTPLSGPRFSGMGVDFWLLGLSLVELAGITAGVEIVVTILKLRAPGMSINRMPLFAWAMLVAGIMILFAFTTLLTATVMLELDRAAGTRFFDPDHGGSSLLWQHLFWFFGHPEVYIIFLPATGIVSMVVAAFAHRISGYVLIVVAMVVIGFISFGLWVHHMFTTGLPELSMSFFTAASLMIALASGTQVFAWIASLWGRRPALKAPLLFVLGFVFLFVLGGITGVMIAVVPFDWQVHDTFFIVAHFHYVLIGGAVFPMLAGLHYWLPKITGRMLDDRLGQWSFWLTFLGFNLTFFPMHIMGFLGMPRRVYTYSASLGLDGYNVAATVGAFILGLGFVLFVVNVVQSLRRGEPAGPDPWGGDSLEWSVASPPPVYSFFSPPIVRSVHPLWRQTSLDRGREPAERARAALTGAPHDWRATLCTDAVNAVPQAIQYLPGPSYVPLWAALGLLVATVGVLTQFYLFLPVGGVVTIAALGAWLWPRERVLALLRASDVGQQAGLPIFTTGSRSTAWWGLICLLAVLATALGALIFSFFYIRLFSETWPQAPITRPGLGLPLVAFALLAASGGLQYWAQRHFANGQTTRTQAGLAASFAAGLVFLGVQFYGLSRLDFTPQTNAFGSLFFVINGFLILLVLTGLILTAAAQIRLGHTGNGQDKVTALQMEITSLFSYFNVVMGLVVFATLYLSPYVV